MLHAIDVQYQTPGQGKINFDDKFEKIRIEVEQPTYHANANLPESKKVKTKSTLPTYRTTLNGWRLVYQVLIAHNIIRVVRIRRKARLNP